MSRLKQIRAQCLQCVETLTEVLACAMFACPLWPFRMTRNPFVDKSAAPPSGIAAKAGVAAPKPRPGCGVDLATLRSWAGRNLPMAVDGGPVAPDPRDMTIEELTALGCTQRSPARALWLDVRDNDAPVAERRAAVAARSGQHGSKPGQNAVKFTRGPGGQLLAPAAGPSNRAKPAVLPPPPKNRFQRGAAILPDLAEVQS
jgi:hypothetical protein